jgi:hypothetical protein
LKGGTNQRSTMAQLIAATLDAARNPLPDEATPVF